MRRFDVPGVSRDQRPRPREDGLLGGLSRLERRVVTLLGVPLGTVPVARQELDEAQVPEQER